MFILISQQMQFSIFHSWEFASPNSLEVTSGCDPRKFYQNYWTLEVASKKGAILHYYVKISAMITKIIWKNLSLVITKHWFKVMSHNCYASREFTKTISPTTEWRVICMIKIKMEKKDSSKLFNRLL